MLGSNVPKGSVFSFDMYSLFYQIKNCFHLLQTVELPPPTVGKEAGIDPVPPPSSALKSSGKTPLEAGCICIFECEPTSSECRGCAYCSDLLQTVEVPPPTVGKEAGFGPVPPPSLRPRLSLLKPHLQPRHLVLLLQRLLDDSQFCRSGSFQLYPIHYGQIVFRIHYFQILTSANESEFYRDNSSM